MKNAVLIVLTVIFMTGCSEQIELPVSDVVKLHRAAESGNLDLVKQLVEAGVDKNAKVGEWQDTALHRAAIYHHKDVAIYLINSEIDLNIMDKNGNTVLDDAIGWGIKLLSSFSGNAVPRPAKNSKLLRSYKWSPKIGSDWPSAWFFSVRWRPWGRRRRAGRRRGS